MVVTKKQAQSFDYRPAVIRDNVFSAGPQEGETIPADTPAEVAHVEIGSDTGVQDFLALVVGVPGEDFKETTKAKPTIDLQNSTPADVPDGTVFWFGVRKSQENGGDQIGNRTDEDKTSEVSVTKREDLTPKQPGVRESYLLTLNTYNASTSHEVSLSDSTIELPVQIAD